MSRRAFHVVQTSLLASIALLVASVGGATRHAH